MNDHDNDNYSYGYGDDADSDGDEVVNSDNSESDLGSGEATGSESHQTEDSGSTAPSYPYYNIGSQDQSEQYESNQGTNTEASPRHKRSLGNMIAVAALIAMVAGVVGGGAFFSVNFYGNWIASMIYQEEETSAESDSSVEDDISNVIQQGSDASSDEASSGSSEGTMTVREVAAQCLPSVVTIAAVSQQELSDFFGGTQIYESSSVGTGVIIGTNDTELLIATNHHLITGASSLSVGFIDETAVSAQIKGEDSDNDLAVIAVRLEDIPDETMEQISIAVIGNSDEVELGDQVVAIGNALGYGQSVTSGYISAKDRDIYLTDGENIYNATDLLQTDAAINAGNSGGPLINMNGEVIGINEAKRMMTDDGTTVEGMGYAIPISKAEPILRELMSYETREKVDEEDRGYLGVTLANVTEDVSEMYNMPIGACITEVLEGSPAEKAGLQRGDVIVEIDGRSVETYSDLTGQLEYYAAGDTVDFVIMRADNGVYVEMTIAVTLGDSSVLSEYYSQG